MRTVRMLVLSPLVTAARASAWSAPAFSRSSRSKPEPTMQGPSQSLRRRKARDDLSMTATEWPSALERDGQAGPHPATARRRSRARHSATRRVGSCKKPIGARRSRGIPSTVWPWRTPTTSGPAAAGAPARHRGRGHPRDPALSDEEPAARAAAGDRAAGHGAAEPAHRPGGPGARLHLVLGLRHRGDADPAGPLRRAWPPSPWSSRSPWPSSASSSSSPCRTSRSSSSTPRPAAPTSWPATTSGRRWPRSPPSPCSSTTR